MDGHGLLDIAIGIALLLFFLHGFRKGLVKSLFSLGSLVAGWIVASRGHVALVARWEGPAPGGPFALRIGAFLLLFLVTVVAVRLGGSVLSGLLKATPLRMVDRLLGGVCGLLAGTLFFGLVFLVVTTYVPAGHDVIVDLEFYGPITGVARVLAQALPDEARERFEHRWKERKLFFPGGRNGFI